MPPRDGSPVPSLTELSFPPEEPFVILRFIYIKPYKNESFLREKYLEERLSIREIASLCFSARSTISANLKAFGIELIVGGLHPQFSYCARITGNLINVMDRILGDRSNSILNVSPIIWRATWPNIDFIGFNLNKFSA